VNETSQDRERIATEERERVKHAYPDEFRDGARRAFKGVKRYPRGFTDWPLDRRNAWFAGFNVGYCDRQRGEPRDGR
jgi:hypothetical protein